MHTQQETLLGLRRSSELGKLREPAYTERLIAASMGCCVRDVFAWHPTKLEHCPCRWIFWSGSVGNTCIAADTCVGLGFEAPEPKGVGDDLCSVREVTRESIPIRFGTWGVRRGGLPAA